MFNSKNIEQSATWSLKKSTKKTFYFHKIKHLFSNNKHSILFLGNKTKSSNNEAALQTHLTLNFTDALIRYLQLYFYSCWVCCFFSYKYCNRNSYEYLSSWADNSSSPKQYVDLCIMLLTFRNKLSVGFFLLRTLCCYHIIIINFLSSIIETNWFVWQCLLMLLMRCNLRKSSCLILLFYAWDEFLLINKQYYFLLSETIKYFWSSAQTWSILLQMLSTFPWISVAIITTFKTWDL